MEDFSLKEIWLIFKRWRKWFFLTTLLIFIPAFLFAITWSNYRSTATIEVKSPEVAASLTTPTGMNPNDISEGFADLRISRIENLVTSTESLSEIITKFNLYGLTKGSTMPAALADKMRSKIRLNLLATNVANPAAANKVSANQLSAIAFTISFDYNDPKIAKLVTDEIVSRFLDEDLKRRREQSQKTSAFLGSQLEALEASMAEQEKKIAEFQTSLGDARPDSLVFNQHAASNIDMNIQSIDGQLTANEGTRGALMAQLAVVDPYSRVIADGKIMTTPGTQLKMLESQYAALSSQYGPEHPDVVRTRNQLEALRKQSGKNGNGEDTARMKAEITDVRTKLKSAEETMGAEHPDVISLQKKLKGLEADLAAAPKKEIVNSLLKKDADNPAYIQLVSQLNTLDAQRSSLLAQREALISQQAKYQVAIAGNPAAEQQMASLTRDLDNSKALYRDLKEKKMSTDMTEQLDRDQGGQRFVVINPPEISVTTEPSRLKILFGGVIFALMCGAGVVVIAQLSNQNILGAQHLSSVVGVAPLIVVPHLFTETEKELLVLRNRALIKASVILCGAALILLAFAIMPLDVLWGVILGHLGLS